MEYYARRSPAASVTLQIQCDAIARRRCSVTATRRSPPRLSARNPNLKARIIFQFHRIASLHADLSSLTAQIPSPPPRFDHQLDQAVVEAGQESRSNSASTPL